MAEEGMVDALKDSAVSFDAGNFISSPSCFVLRAEAEEFSLRRISGTTDGYSWVIPGRSTPTTSSRTCTN